MPKARYPELSVRSKFSRATPDYVVHSTGSLFQQTAVRQIIMIHGFNVPVKKARASYNDFLEIFRAAKWVNDERELGVFWGFHWPGEHPNKIASKPGYSARIMSARESGRLLAEHLGSLHPDQKVYIVAHSLGCRVAMELLTTIRHKRTNYRGASIEGVFLMAAAVPSGLCKGQGMPFAEHVAKVGEHIYYSRRDRVLHLAFPAGQGFFGEPGRAVGRYGTPSARWTSRTNTRLGHGGYWSSANIAEDLGRALGRPVPRRLADQSFDGGHTTPHSRGLPTRNIGDELVS